MPLDTVVSVLLVDDRKDKLLAMQTMLEPLGYRMLKVESGKEALRLLLKEKIHLVVLDVNMPGLDGFETAKLIRERDVLAELPIIFVSAYDVSAEELERGYNLGAVDYIHTPIHPAVLRSRVSTFVTLQVRTEELQKTNVHLRDINQQMNSFVYTISHDLRGPLRSINSFSRILLEEGASTVEPQFVEYLKRIAMSGLKMDNLLNDLLQYSRLTQSELRMEPVEVDALITGVASDLQTEISERGATVDIANGCPAVLGNRTMLRQVLCNLFENALKFVESGAKPSIRVSWLQTGDQVRIVVQDGGIGVAREHYERIFGVFERLHGEKEYPGTGIGLAIVRRAIERMGGRIGIDSELGKGSQFWFELALHAPGVPGVAIAK